jgi:hypothetical protein
MRRISKMIYIHKTGLSFKQYKDTYHLFTDSFDNNFKELHDFAKLIGLKRAWFQNNKKLPHYDIFGNAYEKAKDNGGKTVKSYKKLAELLKKYKLFNEAIATRGMLCLNY